MASTQRIGKTSTSVVVDDDGYTSVVYHNTPVVRFNKDEVILDSGGWRTATTKVRMNQASNQFGLGFTVFQERGEWGVWIRETDENIPFEDGMTIPLGARTTRLGAREAKAAREQRQEVSADIVSRGVNKSAFGINEYQNGYELVHLGTGQTHWLSDGVDMFTTYKGNPISPGTKAWESAAKDWLKFEEMEIYRAYFPELIDHRKWLRE